ncbi:hypothetical protein [Microbacterium sp. NPDC087665]|uniref:hypothetical protein n=1 Tax=Microbacterium sp. NPDC087665 TaxID=3364194 RepID=UPI0037FDFAC4
MIVPQRLATGVLLLVVALGVSGCASPTPQPTETSRGSEAAVKSGDMELRTDLEPIAKRYPQLSTVESIEWMGGTTGETDLGPSTYWIDVVAVLPADEFDALLASTDVETIDAPPLVDGMSEKVPAGPFVGSDELDAQFSAGGYTATVALDPQTRTVVLSGLFE